jgi:hypothetical protein
MKKLLFFVSVVLCSTLSSAQTINSWGYFPQNPTSNDSIQIFVHVTFNSGACPLDSINVIDSAQTIIIEFYHCLGSLTVMCDAYDTVMIAPQPAGAHYVTIREYYAGFPCPQGSHNYSEAFGGIMVDPSTVQGPQFCMIAAKYHNTTSVLEIYELQKCNPAEKVLSLYDIQGRLLQQKSLTVFPAKVAIDAASGLYYYSLEDKGGNLTTGKFVKAD